MLENIALVWKGPAPHRVSRRLPVGGHPARVVRRRTPAIFVTTKDLLVVGATIPLMLALNYFVTAHALGQGDAGDRPGPGDRPGDGHQRRADHPPHLLRRRRARRRGRADPGHVLQHRPCGGWATRPGCARSPPPCSAASATCRRGAREASSSASSPRGAISTSRHAGPTPIVFSILILVLVFRPQGLLGERTLGEGLSRRMTRGARSDGPRWWRHCSRYPFVDRALGTADRSTRCRTG